jgi:hypothetical protein
MADGEYGHDLVLPGVEEVEGERPGIRVRAAGIHLRQRMVSPFENQVVDRRQQRRRQMCRWGRGAHEREDLAITRDRQGDALVER